MWWVRLRSFLFVTWRDYRHGGVRYSWERNRWAYALLAPQISHTTCGQHLREDRLLDFTDLDREGTR